MKVTQHAVDKYISVTGCQDRSQAKKRLLKMFDRSVRVFLDPVVAGQRIVRASHRNGGDDIHPTDYYEFDRYRFAVVNDVIVTFELKFEGQP